MSAIKSLSPEVVEQRLAELAELCALGDALLGAELPPLSEEIFARRALGIHGRVSDAAMRLLPKSFREPHGDARDIVLWADFAGMRHDLGWTPDVVIDVSSGAILDRTPMILVAITQQFDRPMDAIERGWKTIVTFRVLGEPARALEALPLLDSWDAGERVVWLAAARDYDRTMFERDAIP